MYETIQPAEVLPPGSLHVGATASSTALSMPVRVGVITGFELGGRYGGDRSVQIDGKYQLLSAPVDVSLAVSVAHNTVNKGEFLDPDYKSSIGVYPTVLVGKTYDQDGWYVGIKAIHTSEAGIQGLTKEKTMFGRQGWVAGGIIVGGFVHNQGIWLLLEMTAFKAPGINLKYRPAFGVQFELN